MPRSRESRRIRSNCSTLDLSFDTLHPSDRPARRAESRGQLIGRGWGHTGPALALQVGPNQAVTPNPPGVVDHGHGEGVFVRVNACEHPVFSIPSRCFRGRACAGISRGTFGAPTPLLSVNAQTSRRREAPIHVSHRRTWAAKGRAFPTAVRTPTTSRHQPSSPEMHEVYRACDLRSLHWLMRIGGAVR